MDTKADKILNRSHFFNINRLWTDKENNILYVTGFIGTGKSYLAEHFKKRSGDSLVVIHLDSYFDTPIEPQDEEFTKYLAANGWNSVDFWSLRENDHYSQFTMISTFFKVLHRYGELMWNYNRNLIVEGLQIADPDIKYFFRGRSAIVVYGSPIIREIRACKRNNGRFTLRGFIEAIRVNYEWKDKLDDFMDYLEE